MVNICNNRKVSLKTLCFTLLALCLAQLLTACVPLVVGAAAVSAVDLALERRTIGRNIDDNSLEIKLRSNYKTEPRLGPPVNISVTIINGIVLLTGEVHTDEQRQLAGQLPEQYIETRKVVNEIELSGKTSLTSRVNDSYITGKVKTRLLQAEDVPSSNIKVVTERGRVYLLGLVTPAEANTAVNVAKSVRGVTHIIKVFEYIEPEDN